MKRPRWHEASFRSQIVLSTVTVMALGMLLVILVVHLLLESVMSRNVDRVLEAVQTSLNF